MGQSRISAAFAVSSYLKALEDLKKAEDAVERLKNTAAEGNHELPKTNDVQQKTNDVQQTLKTAKDTAQQAQSQQQGSGELSQKDLDTLHAAIDKVYKSAKEQGFIKEPLDLTKVGPPHFPLVLFVETRSEI